MTDPGSNMMSNIQSFFGSVFGSWKSVGSGRPPAVILRPDKTGTAVAGFQGGGDLRMVADRSGQSVGEIIEKINKYRGPDQQIRRLWIADTEVDFRQAVERDTVLIVRSHSTDHSAAGGA
jgi:hypothetical protein